MFGGCPPGAVNLAAFTAAPISLPSWKNGKASLVAQMVKNLPTVLEAWVQSLDREDPLEKEMATRSSILAW